jgi:hypothetical protein
MRVEEYAKEVTQSAGIYQGHPDEKIIHDTIYGVMGRHGIVTADSLMRYQRNISDNMYRNANPRLASRVIPHLSSVLKK